MAIPDIKNIGGRFCREDGEGYVVPLSQSDYMCITVGQRSAAHGRSIIL